MTPNKDLLNFNLGKTNPVSQRTYCPMIFTESLYIARFSFMYLGIHFSQFYSWRPTPTSL